MTHIFKLAGVAVVAISLAFVAGNSGAQDAMKGTWAKKAPMHHARSELQAVALDGKDLRDRRRL